MAHEWPEYVAWIHELPCYAESIGGCEGYVQAHHAGPRPLSRRAHDDTCVALCTRHHSCWHAASGPFKGWDKSRRRAWTTEAVEFFRVAWMDSHTEQPEWSDILEAA